METATRAVRVQIRTPIHGTEVASLIVEQLKVLFPDVESEVHTGSGGRVLRGNGERVDVFIEQIHKQQICDAARARLLQGLDGDICRFRLNKQAAVVSRVSFAIENAQLGEIEVKISGHDDLEQAILDWTEHA